MDFLKLPDATFTPIVHEDAMVAVVYKVTRPTGEPLILKICSRPDDCLREAYFLKQLAGKIPVPQVIDLFLEENAILMECLPGDLLKMEEGIAFEMGALLARIHLNRATGYGDLIQPQLSNDSKAPFTFKFEEGLSECAGHLPNAMIDQCRSRFNEYLDLLSFVDGPCLVHRDFRAGNVIVHEGKIQGVIDWSSGRAGFAEEDFCPLEHSGWPCKQNFLAGYASVRPIPNYQAVMPLLRLNKAIGTIGFLVKRGIDNTRLYQYNLEYLMDHLKR